VFSPERFNRAEEVTSYLDILVSLLRLAKAATAKRGRNYTRLVRNGCAAFLPKPHDNRPGVISKPKPSYNHHFSKHGIRQKAIVIVARKLAIKLWRMTVEKRRLCQARVSRVGPSLDSQQQKRAAHSSTGAYRKRCLVILHRDRHQ